MKPIKEKATITDLISGDSSLLTKTLINVYGLIRNNKETFIPPISQRDVQDSKLLNSPQLLRFLE